MSPTLWCAARRQRFAIRGPEFLLRTYHDRLEAAGFRAEFNKHKRALYWVGLWMVGTPARCIGVALRSFVRSCRIVFR